MDLAVFTGHIRREEDGPAVLLQVRSPECVTAGTAWYWVREPAVFNHDYDTGDYGPVYTRWDARSQAIITRAGYIKRHKDCPSGSHALLQTESVSPGGPHGAWLVHYEIGGRQPTDYWFYVHRRWVFDLPLSNPDAVKLYRMSPQQYFAALGCNH